MWRANFETKGSIFQKKMTKDSVNDTRGSVQDEATTEASTKRKRDTRETYGILRLGVLRETRSDTRGQSPKRSSMVDV